MAARWFTGGTVSTTNSYTGAKISYNSAGVLKIPISLIPPGIDVNSVSVQREGVTIPALAITADSLIVYGQGYHVIIRELTRCSCVRSRAQPPRAL